jgi:hypothetical protein
MGVARLLAKLLSRRQKLHERALPKALVAGRSDERAVDPKNLALGKFTHSVDVQDSYYWGSTAWIVTSFYSANAVVSSSNPAIENSETINERLIIVVWWSLYPST